MSELIKEELDEFDDIKPVLTADELPLGETILWQARPDWWRLALGAFRLRLVGIYFLIFALWRIGVTQHETGSWAEGIAHATSLLPAFGFGVVMIMLLAFLTARATTFTLTNRRLVMRYGVALPAQLNVPLKDVDHAALKLHADGSGDIPLTLPRRGRPSYFQLWPYAKPLKIFEAEPMLRAVPDAAKAADMIAKALVASQGGRRMAVPDHSERQSSLGAGHPATV